MQEHSRKKRPRDINQLAAQIVAEATGELPRKEESSKNPHAQALGRMGGKKGAKKSKKQVTVYNNKGKKK